MARTSLILYFIFSLFLTAYPQSDFNRTANSLGRAAAESFNWMDIPGGALWISSKYFPIKVDNKLDVRSFGIDRQLNGYFYVPGSKSFGSKDPHRFPESVFLTRMVVTSAAGLFFGADTYNSYKHTIIFYKAVMYNHAITELIKNLTHRDRPDESDNRSFFSGHTSLAFVTSSFLFNETDDLLDKHIRDDELRFGLKAASFAALYGWAGYVGYSRMRDNKHYLSDVLTGAVVGTAIGLYFHNLYFGDEPSFFNNFSLGTQGSQPALNFVYRF
jgi:membrane-associated phospholipid phosphatase